MTILDIGIHPAIVACACMIVGPLVQRCASNLLDLRDDVSAGRLFEGGWRLKNLYI